MESDSNDPESVKLCPEIPLQRQHVGDEVCFFLMVHLQFQDGIEELDCVVEGWAASVVEVVHNIGTQHWGQANYWLAVGCTCTGLDQQRINEQTSRRKDSQRAASH